jgi:hypothetical protein
MGDDRHAGIDIGWRYIKTYVMEGKIKCLTNHLFLLLTPCNSWKRLSFRQSAATPDVNVGLSDEEFVVKAGPSTSGKALVRQTSSLDFSGFTLLVEIAQA